MKQLGDLGKTLSDALALVESFQQELEKLNAESEALRAEIKTLRDENATLRAENQKIYLEMNNMRTAKEDLRAANDAFAKNLNQLVIKLNETHEKTMAQINDISSRGFQQIVVDYLNHIRENNTVTVEDDTVEPKYATEIVVEDAETAVEVAGTKRPKMQYAAFYAETNVDADTGDKIELKSGKLQKK